MTDQELIRTLQYLKPGAEWSLSGSDYTGLIWHDSIQTKPTEAELEANKQTQTKAQKDWAALPTDSEKITFLARRLNLE